MLVAEHMSPAHPGPQHHILRGTVVESHTLMDRGATSVRGAGVERGGEKLTETTRCDGALLQI